MIKNKLTEKQVKLLNKMKKGEWKLLTHEEVSSMVGLRQKRIASFGSKFDDYFGKRKYCLISNN